METTENRDYPLVAENETDLEESVNDLARAIDEDVQGIAERSSRFAITHFHAGAMSSGKCLFRFRAERPFKVLALFAGSQSDAGVAATAQADILIEKAFLGAPNTFTQIGKIRFAASGVNGSWLDTVETTFATGDVLRLKVDSTADTTLADVAFTIVGYY